MKKIFVLLTVAMLATTSFAQSAIELAKQKAELNAAHKKLVDAKPTKDAKRQAKALKAEGWTVMAGSKSIELQMTAVQYYGEEQMLDAEGNMTNRYIVQMGMTTAGSYNAAYAAARNQAQLEIAANIKTQLVSAMQTKLDNSQSSAISAVTVDKFNERAKSIVDETLTNSIPALAIYRRLPNNMFEVQVNIVYDKKVISEKIKQNMQKELEQEGDELNSIVDDIVCSKL